VGEKPGYQVIHKRDAPLRTGPSLIDAQLFEPLDLEVRQIVGFDSIADLKRVAADFAVFDIGVAVNREVEDHRNFFSARGTGEKVFHGRYGTACPCRMQLLSEIVKRCGQSSSIDHNPFRPDEAQLRANPHSVQSANKTARAASQVSVKL
jgi:hypothetical protein